MWLIAPEEERLGRRLMDTEINELRHKWNLEAKRYNRELSTQAMGEKRNQEEKRLGRRLTDTELNEMRREFELEFELEAERNDVELPLLEIH